MSKGAGAATSCATCSPTTSTGCKAPGKALYSCLLKPDGTVMDDLIVYFLREDFFRLVVNAGTADKDIAWLRERLARTCADGQSSRRAPISRSSPCRGRMRARALPKALPGAAEAVSRRSSLSTRPSSPARRASVMIARTGYTGEDGFEIVLPAADAAGLWSAPRARRGWRPCGLGARDTLRLEAGMNLYGQDMDETVTPQESGLAWTVDLASPRDFIGKSALAAHPPARQLVGLVLIDKGGVLRAHQTVHTDHGDGEITSGTFSPTLNQSIALARVARAASPPATR